MSLAPEFAPEVFIPERARRSMQPTQRPVQRPVRRSPGAAGQPDAATLLVAAPRTAGPGALTAPGAPHRVAPPRRRGAPAVAPEAIPSTDWNEPHRVAVARPPVTLVLRRSLAPAAALALSAPPVRVTRRGAAVRAAAIALIALGLLVTAWLSAPSSSSAGDAPAMPSVVTVEAGDTLWSLANRLAPGSDPREVVYDLRRINGLDSATLQPGQVLRTR